MALTEEEWYERETLTRRPNTTDYSFWASEARKAAKAKRTPVDWDAEAAKARERREAPSPWFKDVTFDTRWNARPANTGTGDVYDATASFAALSRSEKQQVEAYWRRMQEKGGALYWNFENSDPDEDGLTWSIPTPTAMSNWNIENDGEKWGWKDAMIGEIQRRLASGPDNFQSEPTNFDELFGQDSRGGGGGGGGGPKYVGPMREVVEDTVKAMLTALTGSEDDALIQKYSDQYEKASKQRWDIARSGGTDIDPNQVILENIREQEDYKRIHKLRAEGDSETRWIGDRQARLTQLGVTSQDADDRAIWLAQSGTTLADIDTGALQFSKGRKDITLMGKIADAATMVAGQL